MLQDVMEGKKVWGRPTKYEPKYCQMAIDYMSQGKSLVGFAASINVVTSTIYEWEKNYPEFSEAIKVARQKCQEWWENAGQTGLFMGKEEGSFSQSAWIFNMKARFGYRDKVEHEVAISEIKISKEDEQL